MALADDLLRQSEHLAKLDPGKPRQANLRRAVSSAYYALFHLLIADSIRRFSPKSPANLGLRVARTFTHGEMKQVCNTVRQGHRSSVFDELLPEGFSQELREVAEAFVKLQQARHQADYDLSETFDRVKVSNLLLITRNSFDSWARVRLGDEANVFLAALLFGARWAK